MSLDPLTPDERAELLAQRRPRRTLPMAALRGGPAPLGDAVRPIDEAYRPIYAVWELTLACDLACRHCGSRAGKARKDELGTAEALDLVDQLAELGVHEIVLIGGEAYLRQDLAQIIARIHARGLQALMTTGGRALDARLAQELAATGIDSVSVSIDGQRETHDRLRGVAGSYDAAIGALQALRAAGVQVSANTQINRLSMPELEPTLEMLIGLGIHSWQIQITVAMGRAADEPDVLLQPYDLLDLFPLLGRLAARCKEAGVQLWPGNNVGYFGPFEGALRGGMPRGHMASCGAGRSGLGIESDGTIKGCPSLATDGWAAGNVREHRLVDLWQRAPAMRYTRDHTPDRLWGFCAGCYYAETCRGGCTWTGEALLGKPGNNPMCHHRALELAKQGLRERLVQVESAPGVAFDQGRFELVLEPLPEIP